MLLRPATSRKDFWSFKYTQRSMDRQHFLCTGLAGLAPRHKILTTADYRPYTRKDRKANIEMLFFILSAHWMEAWDSDDHNMSGTFRDQELKAWRIHRPMVDADAAASSSVKPSPDLVLTKTSVRFAACWFGLVSRNKAWNLHGEQHLCIFVVDFPLLGLQMAAEAAEAEHRLSASLQIHHEPMIFCLFSWKWTLLRWRHRCSLQSLHWDPKKNASWKWDRLKQAVVPIRTSSKMDATRRRLGCCLAFIYIYIYIYISYIYIYIIWIINIFRDLVQVSHFADQQFQFSQTKATAFQNGSDSGMESH